MATSRTIQAIATCQRCGGPMPQPASTGRPRVYCSGRCRKAAYDARRHRLPEATTIKLVDRVVIERHDVVTRIKGNHGIQECVQQVAASPRAVANLFTVLAQTVNVNDPKWAPAFRSLDAMSVTLFRQRRR